MSYARSTLDKLKREISDFQKEFRKSHGRLPHPDDIKKANMAKVYREHKRLKALVGKTEDLREKKLQKLKQKGISRSYSDISSGGGGGLMTPKSGSPLSTPVEVTPTFPSLARAQSAVFTPAAISSSSSSFSCSSASASSSGFPRYSRVKNRSLKLSSSGGGGGGGGGAGAPFSARRQNLSSHARFSAARNPPKRRKTLGASPRSSTSRSLSSVTGATATGSASAAAARLSAIASGRRFTSPVRRSTSSVSPNENRPPLASPNSLRQQQQQQRHLVPPPTGSPMSRFASRHKIIAKMMAEERGSTANSKQKQHTQQPLTFQTVIPETPPRLDRTRSVFARGSRSTSSHGVSKLILSPENSNDSLCATPPNPSKPSIKRAQSMLLVPTRSTTVFPEKSKPSAGGSLPVEVPDSMEPPSPRLPRTKSTLTDRSVTSRDRLNSPLLSRSSSALSVRNENSTSRFAAVFGRTLSGGGGSTQMVTDSSSAQGQGQGGGSTPALRTEALMMPGGQGTLETTASLVGSTGSGSSSGPTTFDHFLRSNGEANAPKPRANPLLLNASSPSSSGPLSSLGFQSRPRTQSGVGSSQLSTSSNTATTSPSSLEKATQQPGELKPVLTARSQHANAASAMSDSSNPSGALVADVDGGNNSLACVPGTPSPVKGRARSRLTSSSSSSSSLLAVATSRSRSRASTLSLSQHTEAMSREPLTDISRSSVSNAAAEASGSVDVPMRDSTEADTFAAFLPPSGAQSRPGEATASPPTPSPSRGKPSVFSPASPRPSSAPYPKCKLPSGPRAPPSPGTPLRVGSSSTGGTPRPPSSSPTKPCTSPDEGAFMSPKPRSSRKLRSRASVPMSPLAQSLDFMIKSPLRGAGVPLTRTLSQFSSHSRGFARATAANRLLSRTASTPFATQLFSKQQASLFPTPGGNNSRNAFLSKKSKPLAMSPQRVSSHVLSRADSVGTHFPHMRAVNTVAGEGKGLGECDSQRSVSPEKDVEMSKGDAPTSSSTENGTHKPGSSSSEEQGATIPLENTTSLPPLSDDEDNSSMSNDFQDMTRCAAPVAATDAQKVAQSLLSMTLSSCSSGAAATKLFTTSDKKDATPQQQQQHLQQQPIPMSRPTLLSEAMKDTSRPRRTITPLTTPFSKTRRRRSSRSSSKRNGSASKTRKQLLQAAGGGAADKPASSLPDATGIAVAASIGSSPMRPLSLFSGGDQSGKAGGQADRRQDAIAMDKDTSEKALLSQQPQLGDSSPIAKHRQEQQEAPSERKPRRSTRKRKASPSPSKGEDEASDIEPRAVEFEDGDGDDEDEVDVPQSDDGGESSDYAPASRRSGVKRKRSRSAASPAAKTKTKATAKRRASAAKGAAKRRRKTVATAEDAAAIAEPPALPSGALRRSTRARRQTATATPHISVGAFDSASNGSSCSGYSQSGYSSDGDSSAEEGEHTIAATPPVARKATRRRRSAKANLAVPAAADPTSDGEDGSGTAKAKTPRSTKARAKKSSAAKAKTKKPAATATKKKAVRAKKAPAATKAKPKAKAKPPKKKAGNFQRQMTNLKKTRYQRKRQPGHVQAGRSRFHNSRRGKHFKDWAAIRTERDLYMEKRNEALYTDLLDEKEMETAVKSSTTQAMAAAKAASSATNPTSSSTSSSSQANPTPTPNATPTPLSTKNTFQSQILSETSQSSKSSFKKPESIYTPSSSSIVSFSSAVDASGATPEGERKTNADFYMALRQKTYAQEQAGGASNLDLTAILEENFGHARFRLGQLEAIQRTIDGRSTLLLMPTGGGKSLCYQLPALVLPGMALIVTPLLSLMQDQLQRLPPCLRGAVWNSSQNISDQSEVRKRICAKEIDILYISPERLFSPGFQRFLQRTYIDQCGGELAFACVDEAHCVSEWSHNFRPAYLQLNSVLRQELNVQTVLAMTATATRLTERSVCRHLSIARGNILRFDRHRTNLCLSVSRDTRDRLSALKDLLRSARFRDLESLIIYCGMKRECDAVAAALRAVQIDAHSYHGDLKRHERKQVQDRFMAGTLRIVVATISFGMGLDKQDVRGVIHFSPPRTLEHYVQEIGRAGRDGRPAQCHCFYDDRDMTRMKSLIYSDGIDEWQIFSLLISIFGEDPTKLNPGHYRAVCQDSIAKKCDVAPEVITTLISQVNEVANIEAAAKRSEKKAAASAAADKEEAASSSSSMTDDKVEQTALEKEIAMLMDGVAEEFAAGCTLEEEQMAANVDDLLRILPDLHNVARVGFIGNIKTVSSHVPVAKYIVANIKPRSGFYRVKVTDAANRMGVGLNDVQAQLARMRAVGDITLEWSDKSNCIQVIKHPEFADEQDDTENAAMSDADEEDFSMPTEYETTKFAKLKPAYARSLRTLARKILENLSKRERMQLNKVNTVLQAFRLVAYPRWKDYDPTATTNASGSSLTLASIVEKYFQTESDEALLNEIESELSEDERLVAMTPVGNESLERDITVTLKVLLGSYDEQLNTAREITRILHGIQTKRFPWKMWSKNDAWRKHASYPFADLLKLVQAFLDKRKAKAKKKRSM